MAEEHQPITARILDGLDDSRQTVLELLETMRRTLYLYTPIVRPELYNDAAILAAIRQRVTSQPKLRLHLLLPPARGWRNTCPGLLQLNDRLSTALVLRTPNPEELPSRPELVQGFVIADERTLLHFSDPRRLLGLYEPQPTERMKELLDLFGYIWTRSHTDPELRRLGI